jgi:transcriptional regulator with XRE-family HTH domain
VLTLDPQFIQEQVAKIREKAIANNDTLCLKILDCIIEAKAFDSKHRLSLSELAKRTGINPGTIYRLLFGSKKHKARLLKYGVVTWERKNRKGKRHGLYLKLTPSENKDKTLHFKRELALQQLTSPNEEVRREVNKRHFNPDIAYFRLERILRNKECMKIIDAVKRYGIFRWKSAVNLKTLATLANVHPTNASRYIIPREKYPFPHLRDFFSCSRRGRQVKLYVLPRWKPLFDLFPSPDNPKVSDEHLTRMAHLYFFIFANHYGLAAKCDESCKYCNEFATNLSLSPPQSLSPTSLNNSDNENPQGGDAPLTELASNIEIEIKNNLREPLALSEGPVLSQPSLADSSTPPEPPQPSTVHHQTPEPSLPPTACCPALETPPLPTVCCPTPETSPPLTVCHQTLEPPQPLSPTDGDDRTATSGFEAVVAVGRKDDNQQLSSNEKDETKLEGEDPVESLPFKLSGGAGGSGGVSAGVEDAGGVSSGSGDEGGGSGGTSVLCKGTDRGGGGRSSGNGSETPDLDMADREIWKLVGQLTGWKETDGGVIANGCPLTYQEAVRFLCSVLWSGEEECLLPFGSQIADPSGLGRAEDEEILEGKIDEYEYEYYCLDSIEFLPPIQKVLASRPRREVVVWVRNGYKAQKWWWDGRHWWKLGEHDFRDEDGVGTRAFWHDPDLPSGRGAFGLTKRGRRLQLWYSPKNYCWVLIGSARYDKKAMEKFLAKMLRHRRWERLQKRIEPRICTKIHPLRKGILHPAELNEKGCCAKCGRKVAPSQLRLFDLPKDFEWDVREIQRKQRTSEGTLVLMYNGYYLCDTCTREVHVDMYRIGRRFEHRLFRKYFKGRDLFTELGIVLGVRELSEDEWKNPRYAFLYRLRFWPQLCIWHLEKRGGWSLFAG